MSITTLVLVTAVKGQHVNRSFFFNAGLSGQFYNSKNPKSNWSGLTELSLFELTVHTGELL